MNMDYDEIQEPERGVADAAWRWTTCWNRLRPSCSTHCWRKTRNWARKWALWQAVDAKLLKAHWRPSRRWWLWRSLSGGRRSERQRRLWFGLIVGVMAATLWVGLLAGLAGAGAYVMFRQADTLVALVHGVAYWYSALQSQLDIIVSAASALLGTTQVRGALLVYVAVAALTLACWVRFLRRSVEMEPNGPAYVRSA